MSFLLSFDAFAANTLTRLTRAAGVLVLGAALALGAAAPSMASEEDETFSENEIVDAIADFFGVTSEAAGKAVERVFDEYGRPNAYIVGEEASGAVGVGLRYGKGQLRYKAPTERRYNRTVYWQGPSIGFDAGGNASKVFTLVYDLNDTERLFQRFPGVEGSAYYIAGIGVNYQKAGGIVLAPMRAGVGLRLGANVGYLAYSKKRNWLPF